MVQSVTGQVQVRGRPSLSLDGRDDLILIPKFYTAISARL